MNRLQGRSLTMGNIWVDGQPAGIEAPPSATVAKAFETVRNQVVTHSRVIVDVLLNGQSISWNDGSAAWNEPFDESSDLKLTMADPSTVSGPLLDRIIGLLPDIAARHRAAAKTLREGRQTEGVQQTVEIVPWWKEMQEALHQIRLLHQIEDDPAGNQALGNILTAPIQRVATNLEELREAADLKDFVLVADLMDYELAPLAEDWRDVCRRIKELLSQRTSKEGFTHGATAPD